MGLRYLVLAALCLSGLGCIVPRMDWRPEPFELPPLPPHAKATRVVVLDFTRQEPEWGVVDIAREVASHIRWAGLDARVAERGRPEPLKEGEFSVRGTIREVRDTDQAAYDLQRPFTCCTCGVYGCVLPLAFPAKIGAVYDVRVEILDCKDTLLADVRKELTGICSYNSMLEVSLAGQPKAMLSDALARQVAKEIARRLRE